MAKQYRSTGTPSIQELERDINKALDAIIGTPQEQMERLLGLGTMSIGARVPKTPVTIRVNLVTQVVHIQWPCGASEDHFNSANGERHLRHQLETKLSLHSFPSGPKKPPMCGCYLAPIKIDRFRMPLVQIIPGQHAKVMAEIAAAGGIRRG